jgi:hypothetical protein
VYFTAVTLCAAYSANLVSSLAVQTNVLPFKNFQQMLKRNDFEMGVVNNSAVLSELEVSFQFFFFFLRIILSKITTKQNNHGSSRLIIRK